MTDHAIVTAKGQRILVDAEDYEALSGFAWRVDHRGYACRHPTVEGHSTTVLMHREILGMERGNGLYVDHINGNRIDNRRANLRTCTNAENVRNQKRSSKNTTGFKGVMFHKGSGKWYARIKFKGKGKYLGRYSSPELAYEVYCLAADMLHGEFANYG